MYWLYICQIASQSVRKWLLYHPKALKMSICKIFKFVFFFWQKYVIQKDENTIELPVKLCIKTMLFVAKITTLRFSPFFNGISQIHVLKFKLTLTSHLTYFKKVKHSSEPSRYKLSIAAFRVFLRPFVFLASRGRGVIFTPLSTARLAGDPSALRVN